MTPPPAHPPSPRLSPPLRAEASRSWHRPVVMVPLFVLVAAAGGRFGSFTVRANLLVLGVGALFMWIGVSGRAGRRPAPAQLSRAALWWLVPVLALSLVELYAFSRQSVWDYPTLSLLADPILDGYPARAACYFLWLVAFWGLVRR